MKMKNVKKAEKEIMDIVQGRSGADTTKVDKMAKWSQDKFEGKKNPPRMISYGQFVDLVAERRAKLRQEVERRR